jgi:3',5'-cyclic AMP phosphodiesterase CpdA
MKTIAKIVLEIPNKPSHHFSFKMLDKVFVQPAVYRQPRKMLAISDIEGNFIAFCKMLQKCGVIDKYLKWKFGDGHLVIVGDCFDRGEQVTECLWLIYSLEERARLEGGRVHFILGNHEIMNMNGDWRYVHPKYASSSSVPFTALYNGNDQLWRWLCTKNIVEIIGDTLFVHGGISPELLNLKLSIMDINTLARSYYLKANQGFTDPVLRTIFSNDGSPFWYRGYYRDEATESNINDVLAYYKVKTIVTGHTLMENVTSFFDGKVINIDTDHAAGKSEALLIKKRHYYRVCNNGKFVKIKD